MTDPGRIDAFAAQLPVGRDPASVRARLVAMERLLEGMFVIPGTNRRIGLDAIVGLVPVIGDLIGAAMGSWLIWEARNLGMSKFQLVRMGGNVAVDTVLGAVPLVGDAFDILFRSNRRNLRIILKWLDKHHPETRLIEGEVVARRV
ncbi:MAG: DUF4112 domain-containing protein [Allosphingosinicella sp.]|uniref:DUF4112 domain-containing protein n=1 Tax=Allosphingosinicella sp. TaxID=2823234 RepID=UPI00394B064A